MAATRQTFKIDGLSDLDDALSELPKATSRNVQLRTLKKVAQPIANEAMSLAPDDPKTGGKDLHTSILVATVPAKRRDADVEVAVGPSQNTFYGMFHEFGTAHLSPHPFMRPAWDNNNVRALYGIRDTLAEEIEKARKRIAKKAEREAAKLK